MLTQLHDVHSHEKIIKDIGKTADVVKPNIFSPQHLTTSGKKRCMKDTDKIPEKSEEENQCCMSLKINQPSSDLELNLHEIT